MILSLIPLFPFLDTVKYETTYKKICILAIVLMVGCYAQEKPAKPAAAPEAEALSKEAPEPEKPATTPVTLDGYDSASVTTIQEIRLWKDYDNRAAGVAGTARHGQKVEMIERKGDGVLIETSSGVTGWVTYYFIKELK